MFARTAAGGGRSRVLDVATLRREIGERVGSDAVQRLEREPVPWQIADYLGGGVVWRPILGPSTVRWRRYTIDAAREATELSDSMTEILDSLDELITRSDRVFDFLMEEGELLFMDNRRTLHSRTPIHGDRQTSERLMLRSWIQSREGPGSSRSNGVR